jgi:glycine cleavage system aminomethyltransferase T
MKFMTSFVNGEVTYEDQPIIVSRLGYTGEDGYEVAVPNSVIDSFMQNLIQLKDTDGT